MSWAHPTAANLSEVCPPNTTGNQTTPSLAATMQRLQDARRGDGGRTGSFKRPAASKANQTKMTCKMKLPAAAPSKHKISKTTRKTSKAGSSKKNQKQGSADLKKELFKLIPAALLRKWGRGCSKCRYIPKRTPSCWKGRGFTL